MKKVCAWMLLLAVLAPVCALADVSLMMELPQDAQMVENVEFDDGDYIRTYQIGGGYVQLLRYAGFDMTAEELAQSEYPGDKEARPLEIGSFGGFPAAALRFVHQEEGQEAQDISIVCVNAGEATLIFKAAFPKSLGDAQIESLLQGMTSAMDVSMDGESEIDETAEVG